LPAPLLTSASFRRLALVIAIVGTLHGLVYVPLVQSNTVTDSGPYVAAAEAILDGNYSTPLKASFYYDYPFGFFDITGLMFDRSVWAEREPQAFRPPGYPLFLALAGGGGDGVSQAVALLGQALLFGLGTALLALTVRRWWGEGLALGAAALYALDPYSKHYVALVLSEQLAAVLVLGGAYAFTRAWQSRLPAWWATTGALAAGLTLVRAAFVVAVPLVVLAAALRGPFGRDRLRALGAAAASAALLLTPWLAWTDHVTGKPVLASYGEGFNLLVAAHGEGYARGYREVITDPAFLRDLRSAHRSAPRAATIRADARAHPRYVRRADEALRSRARALLADRLGDEPLRVAWEVAYRAFFLWNAHNDWYQPRGPALLALRAIDWLTLALGLAGAGIAVARGGAARGIVVFLLAYTAIISTHHVEARFAMPIRGLLLALVALALARLGSAAVQRPTGRV
jgi:hypothetical protein